MFSEYEHMENHYNIYKVLPTLNNLDNVFIALEKIHGTNYSFLCNGYDVIPCKRTSTLGNDRGYFGHGQPFMKYRNDILTIFTYIKKTITDLEQIQIYCELFGGKYEGKTTKGYKCVQNTTNYLAENEIMAYDIKITTTATVANPYYYNFEDMQSLFQILQLQIKLVPICATGTLEEMLALSPIFKTRVSGIYELDGIGIAEGFVIKPLKESTFTDGSRLIFKLKNPAFNEVNVASKVVMEKTLTFQQICLEKLKLYVTENRFDNIITKYIDESNDVEKLEKIIIPIFIKDVQQDFIADHQDDPCANDYIVACDKAFTGFVTGFIKKMIGKRN